MAEPDRDALFEIVERHGREAEREALAILLLHLERRIPRVDFTARDRDPARDVPGLLASLSDDQLDDIRDALQAALDEVGP